MLDLAAVGPNDVVYDLGSGDGRLVILAAQLRGARGVGVEIQPSLVVQAQTNATEAEVGDRVRFVEGDLYTTDVSDATVVLLYLSVGITRELTDKLRRELRPGARIVSQQFRLAAEWPADRLVVVDGVELRLWVVPDRDDAGHPPAGRALRPWSGGEHRANRGEGRGEEVAAAGRRDPFVLHPQPYRAGWCGDVDESRS